MSSNGTSQSLSRPYFTPTPIDDQLARSKVNCAKACLAILGSEEEVPAGPQTVKWHEILQSVCPLGAEIYPFTDARDLRERAGNNLDRLYVATINKVVGSTNHAMILWKPKNAETNVFRLFDPGNYKFIKTINISNQRHVANWNGICAVFIPVVVILQRENTVIDLT